MILRENVAPNRYKPEALGAMPAGDYRFHESTVNPDIHGGE